MAKTEITKKSENPHEGHRERMRAKIENGFITSFTDVELLESLLFYVIKRSNTNVTAHNLLDKFGTLKDVFSADPEIIKSVDGVGETSAVFFAILSEINRRIASSSGTVEKRFSSVEQIGEYFIKKFKRITEEKVMLLLLDNKNAVIDCKTIENGTVSSSVLPLRDVAKEALLANGSIDLVWNGMTITDERLAEMEISVPYLANKQVAVVKKADAAKYGATKDEFFKYTADAVIIAEKGSAGEELVKPVE